MTKRQFLMRLTEIASEFDPYSVGSSEDLVLDSEVDQDFVSSVMDLVEDAEVFDVQGLQDLRRK